jgi:hypothetical protein
LNSPKKKGVIMNEISQENTPITKEYYFLTCEGPPQARDRYENKLILRYIVLAIMAPIGFSSYCTLKLPFPRVTVLPQV